MASNGQNKQLKRALKELETNIGQIRQECGLAALAIENSPSGIVILDRERNFVYANARSEQLFGIWRHELQRAFEQDMIGFAGGDALVCLAEVFQRVLATGKPVFNYPGTSFSTGDNTVYLSVNGAPIFNQTGSIEQVVLSVNDLTRHKMETEEILKADKLESLGLLSGGIAHDFNNFLAVILGNVSLVKMQNKDDTISKNLEHIEKAVIRASELTQKLFVFTRGGAAVKKPLNLQKLLLDSVGFVLSGSASVYEINITDDLLLVEADEVQIVQVINNILINAVQAMSGGGKIEITASNLTAGGDQQTVALLPDGEYVLISIADHGPGIPADHLGKIFDPFFSTKPKGSGLGLAGAYMIVQNHGGLIRVESLPGAGTTFSIYLPAMKSSCSALLEEKEDKLYFGEGRILVMDDDEHIREICKDMLEYLGYRVSQARDGMDALQIYREAIKVGLPYAAVIMDLTVPGGVGAKEAIEVLRRLDPTVKAVVSSGYSNDPVIANYQDHGFSGYLQKPYQISELSALLNKLIKAPRFLFTPPA